VHDAARTRSGRVGGRFFHEISNLTLFPPFSCPLIVQVVMLGLDAAGKTTILYKLHIGEVLSTVPTIGKWKKEVSTFAFGVGGRESSTARALFF